MTTGFATRVQRLGEFSADTVTGLLASAGATIAAKNGVRAATLGYATHDVLGRTCRASGLIAAPLDLGGERDVVVWLHGTSVNRNDVPSHPADLTSKLLAALFASAGFLFVAPDYLGLGVEGEGPHPYLHARSEASASLDMLLAARNAAPEALGVSATRRVFLTGFSQGGHAALALQRDLEAAAAPPFDVAACATVSGPYNLSAITVPIVYQRPGVNTCGYLGYLLTSYRELYGIYNVPAEVFVPPYDRIAPRSSMVCIRRTRSRRRCPSSRPRSFDATGGTPQPATGRIHSRPPCVRTTSTTSPRAPPRASTSAAPTKTPRLKTPPKPPAPSATAGHRASRSSTSAPSTTKPPPTPPSPGSGSGSKSCRAPKPSPPPASRSRD